MKTKKKEHGHVVEGQLTVTQGLAATLIKLPPGVPREWEVCFEHQHLPPCNNHHVNDNVWSQLVKVSHREYDLLIEWKLHSPIRTIRWKVAFITK